MCLEIQLKKRHRDLGLLAEDVWKHYIRVAEEDTKCYKVLTPTKDTRRFLSAYRGFPYVIGGHYFQKGRKFTFWNDIIDKMPKEVYKFSDKGILGDTISIYQGLHATIKKKKAKKNCDDDEVVGVFIMPKKSVYFINEDTGEIATDNLIFEGILQNEQLQHISG